MRERFTPLRWAIAAVAGFVALFTVAGVIGWGAPAANEQAIGEVSRWCERVSGWFLREPINTLGNLGFVVAGLAMFRMLANDDEGSGGRFFGAHPVALLYASAVVFLGPGSMVMHGSHTFFGAWIDNVSMVAYITIPWLVNVADMARWRHRTLFAVYSAVVTGFAFGYWFFGPGLGIGLDLFGASIGIWVVSEVLHRWWSPTTRWAAGFVGFAVALAFGVTPLQMAAAPGEYWWMLLMWLPGMLATHPPTVIRRHWPWFWAGIVSFLVAYAIWQTGTSDHPWCTPDSVIQAHAIWHLLSALATWCFFVYFRTERDRVTSEPAVDMGR